MATDNLSIKEPEYRFYQVTVEIEVEHKVSQMMDGTMADWKISSMSISKICSVY